MSKPVLVQPIPAQVLYEQVAGHLIDLTEYIDVPVAEDEWDQEARGLFFSAQLESGEPLPAGILCAEQGYITGIPQGGTVGTYRVMVTAQNEAGALEVAFDLSVAPMAEAVDQPGYADQMKAQIWHALSNKLPVPDLGSLHDRAVSISDVYYLMERWAALHIWNANDLKPSTSRTLMDLKGASQHYLVYDMGNGLCATPKDLYSMDRTLEDALQTARAMMREVFRRGWTIQMAGFEKMERAVWVEAQLLEDQHSKKVEIIQYEPTLTEVRVYNQLAQSDAPRPREER